MAPRIAYLFLAAVVLLPTSRTRAEELVLTLDPEHTTLGFLLGATGHDVHGVLQLQHGAVGFDPATSRAWGEIAIDARGAATGNAKRDKAMHRKVLLSEQHPLILLRVEKLDGTVALDGESDFALLGTVTLLGVEHPLRIPTHASVKEHQVTATAVFPVPYVEWGLHDPSAFVLRVAKSVDVTLGVAGTLAGASNDVPTGGR